MGSPVGPDATAQQQPSRLPVQVLLLSQEQCSFCDHAKAIVDRLAAEYPLSVRTLDVASPEGRALAERGGILFPPGVFLDGEPFSYGQLSERRLRRELRRRLETKGWS